MPKYEIVAMTAAASAAFRPNSRRAMRKQSHTQATPARTAGARAYASPLSRRSQSHSTIWKSGGCASCCRIWPIMSENDIEAFWTVRISSSQSDFAPSPQSRSVAARMRIAGSQYISGAVAGRSPSAAGTGPRGLELVRSAETRMSSSEDNVTVKSMDAGEICQG